MIARRGLPFALLGVTVFFWGTAFHATDVGAAHATPVVFSLLRAVPAAIALAAVAALARTRLPRGRTLLLAALSGPLLVTLAFEGIAEGTTLAGAGNAAVLINTTPFFVVLLGRIFLGERVSWPALVGIGVGFAGVVVMVSSQLGGDRETGDLVLGMGIALIAGAGFAVGTLLVKAASEGEPNLDVLGFTVVQYAVGALVLVPLALGYGHLGATDWGAGDLWTATAWVALGSSALGSLAFYGALRLLPAARASAWQFLAPVVAVVVEIAYGHGPGPVVLAGMALAVSGVALVSAAPALGLGRARAAREAA